MSERSILAYFPNFMSAAAAKDELLSMGLEVAKVDHFGRYGEDIGYTSRNPTGGDVASQVNMLLNTEHSDDARILIGSDPSISGLSSDGMAGGRAYILTAIADDEQVDKAVAILKRHGGLV